ncbi:MAG: deoxyribodipyrimidine photo-lyase [Acidimicrobiales bacterium]|nr:deoxyribodipyrimidine photo-lyase [Acidimicrobiales bacterium]MCB9395754.1 deoxyribodipyrimidine photo-lyase [Acidimicrobiaceae bacterium]
MPARPRAVLWFRRDLRLDDHPALAATHAHGDVVPLFVVDPAFAAAGLPRRGFMASALQALDERIGGALVYRHGDPVDVVPAFAAEVGADVVIVTRDHGPYGHRRDAAVAARLAVDGRKLRGVGSNYAVDPGTVHKADRSSYSVFTPFSKAWLATGQPRWAERPATPRPAHVTWVGHPDVACDGPPAVEPHEIQLPEATEAAAHRQWQTFLADGLDQYDAQRNQPGLPGTSRLSPYLRWGVLHPLQLIDDLGTERPHQVFRSELAWREFYADVLFRRPDTAWRNLQEKMDAMPVDTDARARRRFAAWAEGRTGVPIVDAGMRQLLATGWMHNRVRMITASYLVKDLHLPWQWGARHFMVHLVDGDLASNQHGWQWTAGTGTDAAPYFRVFNPYGQSEKFDPDGHYLRRWVPELAGLDDRTIHDPGLLRPDGYPAPIVDHAAEREEALRRYRSLGGAAR